MLVREVSAAVLAAEFPVLNEDLKGLYAGNARLAPPFGLPDRTGNHIHSAAYETKPLNLSPLALPLPPDDRKP